MTKRKACVRACMMSNNWVCCELLQTINANVDVTKKKQKKDFVFIFDEKHTLNRCV